MTLQEATSILEAHNKWRRDNDGKHEMTTPKLLGEAIDMVVAAIRKNEIDHLPLRERYVVVADRGSRLPCLYCCFYVARTEDCSMPPEIADVLPNCVRDNVHFKEAKS